MRQTECADKFFSTVSLFFVRFRKRANSMGSLRNFDFCQLSIWHFIICRNCPTSTNKNYTGKYNIVNIMFRLKLSYRYSYCCFKNGGLMFSRIRSQIHRFEIFGKLLVKWVVGKRCLGKWDLEKREVCGTAAAFCNWSHIVSHTSCVWICSGSLASR